MVGHLDESEEHEEQYSHNPHIHEHEATSLHLEPANHYDLAHAEPEVSHEIDTDAELNEMKWDTLHETAEISGDAHCPIGYTKIGCCRCVMDMQAPTHHIMGPEHHDLAPTIHGMPESNSD